MITIYCNSKSRGCPQGKDVCCCECPESRNTCNAHCDIRLSDCNDLEEEFD